MSNTDEFKLEEILKEKNLEWAFRKSGKKYKVIEAVIDKSDCDQVKILYESTTCSVKYTRSVSDFYDKFTPVLK